jgi:hypothetical protein
VSDSLSISSGTADERSRQQLENVETVRENLAIQANASIGYALEWIKEHEAEFEFPVGKPPMISVNVPQKQYAWQVEQSLTFGQKCASRQNVELWDAADPPTDICHSIASRLRIATQSQQPQNALEKTLQWFCSEGIHCQAPRRPAPGPRREPESTTTLH